MEYTVHRVLQARILEWVAFPFSRTSSQPRDQTQVSHIAGGLFTSWATREDAIYIHTIYMYIYSMPLYTAVCYSATKKNEMLPFANTDGLGGYYA